MRKKFLFFLVIAMWAVLTACDLQGVIPSEGEADMQVAENEKESDSEFVADSEAVEIDDAEETSEDSDTEDVSTSYITEAEIRKLVDENYFCITNVFKYGRLSGAESESGRIPVSQEHFASYGEFEAYIRSIYMEEEADYLLYEYCCGFPLYYEKDGVFYRREELFGGGMACPWESYTIEVLDEKEDECTFSVFATYPKDATPEGVTGERYEFLAVKEDGWKLAYIVSRSDCGVEEAQQMLAEERAETGVDIDYENLITETEALDIAYGFYYDGDMEQYSAYCESMPYFDPENNAIVRLDGVNQAPDSGLGYVVVQYDENNVAEQFDAANPSENKVKTCLTYVGKSENEAFYVFWLYSYIPEGDGNYRYSTLDYILVTVDGREIVSNRNDIYGNEIADPEDWREFMDFLDCDILNSWFF